MDDEYLAYMLATAAECSGAAHGELLDRMVRALHRNPRLRETMLGTPMVALTEGDQGVAFVVDYPRIERALESLVAGLYYHDNRVRAEGRIRVMCNAIRLPSGGLPDLVRSWIAQAEHEFRRDRSHGSNPEVFTYQARYEHDGGFLILMRIFGGLKVLAGGTQR